jgi:anthranilate/para-aminobenzoate synthase component I
VETPELIIYNPKGHDTEFLRFADPNSWLVIPGDGTSPRRFPEGRDVGDDPFEAIEQFFDRQGQGFVAGWVSYDFARLNPDYDLGLTPDLGYPLALFASFQNAERFDADERLPEQTVELGQFDTGLSAEGYRRRIRNLKGLIRRGYLYQLNYSHRFQAEVRGSLRDLLLSIPRQYLPPQTAYCRWNGFESLSLSPERFFSVDGRTIRTEPIKGTRPRGSDHDHDRSLRRELLNSQKDRAEHVMIVDLERNDLNRVCEPGSVHVPSLVEMRTFPTVHHLVSTIEGRLRDDVRPVDCFRELFPGGSVTGCPKPIALRVIDQMEPRCRGLYTGTIGFWDRNRDIADWNIAIRTLVRRGDRVTWDSGGGIVIDSDENDEYDESLDKVQLIRTIRSHLNRSRERTLSGDVQ